MPYVVHIKQLATSIVRSRVEDGEWGLEARLWTKGSRACDCARALLFAHDREVVASPCGISAYVIRVAAADGTELYCEDGFDPFTDELFDEDIPCDAIASPMGERIGIFARQALDRLAIQIGQYTASTGLTSGRRDQG